jgi:phosphate transport system permease protein
MSESKVRSAEPATPERTTPETIRRYMPGPEVTRRRLKKRHRAERNFRLLCLAAVGVGVGFLALLFFDIISKAYTAFFQTRIQLEIYFDPAVLDPAGTGDPQALATADYAQLWRAALLERFPEVSGRSQRRELNGLVSTGATYQLQDMAIADPALVGTSRTLWVTASDEVDILAKGRMDLTLAESERPLSDQQVGWVQALEQDGVVAKRFNLAFFTTGDSRDPEMAGIGGAIVGSFYTLLITLALAFPLGVATAVYLEEFAPRNRWVDLIEVNINNLAAVPSIVFGLLGLAVFLNVFNLPRSAPLVGGLVLSLMTLPVIIIASRSALQAVPPSIREAAYGVGATPLQVVSHHVLPLALPGILTGTIIGMARALGETAPLLMIGMVAFIVDVPKGPLDPATVLPVQVYLWADSPERAFVEKTSAAILCLLVFLIAMNAGAVWLRKRTEKRW